MGRLQPSSCRVLGRFALALTALSLAAGAFAPTAGCGEVRITGHRAPKIKFKVLKEGVGARAREGQLVDVHYTGKLPDGTVFMNTRDKGSPHTWRLGDHSVIQGMDMAVAGMRPGEIRRVKIPPELHWGRRGYGGAVPENATLTFEIELVNVR